MRTVLLEKTQNLATSDALDLGNAVRVTEDDTNLRGGQTLLGELADVVLDVLGGDLEPRRRGTLVRASRLGHTLTTTVHATHGELVFCLVAGERSKTNGGS